MKKFFFWYYKICFFKKRMSKFYNSIIKYCKISSCQKFMSKNDLIFDIFDKFPRYVFYKTFEKIDYARNLNISKFNNSIMKTL